MINDKKQKPRTLRYGVIRFRSNSIWRCPTLTWGNPTLPSALRHFTSEFGMESGRTTALWSPEYPVMIHLIILSILLLKTKNKPQNLSFPPQKTLERCIVKPLGQLVSVSSTAHTAYTPDLSTS